MKGDELMQFLEKLSNFISKYMAVFVILVAVIALFQPWTFKWAAPNIAILLGIVMFGMGTTLRLRDFRRSSPLASSSSVPAQAARLRMS